MTFRPFPLTDMPWALVLVLVAIGLPRVAVVLAEDRADMGDRARGTPLEAR